MTASGPDSAGPPEGKHILCEYRRCDRQILQDQGALEQLMRRAVDAAGATVVDCLLHRFAPQGVSGVVLVEESHLSIHTWPEHGYAAVDFYTCGDCDPERAHPVLRAGLHAGEAEVMVIGRGALEGLQVRDHRAEGPEPAPATSSGLRSPARSAGEAGC